MISRRYKVQEKRMARRAIVLISLSIALFLFLVLFGIPALARFAAFVGDLRSSSEPILSEDKTPPAPPFVETLPDYAKERKLTIRGNAEASSTLKVFLNGEQVKETLIDDTSSFSLEITIQEGENRIWAKAIDKAGNESDSSRTQTVIYDNQPPTLEITRPQDGESFFGSNKSVTIEGKTEPEARVIVNERVAIVDPEGSFTINFTLAEGENTITVKAVDGAENETEKSLTVSYSP